MSQGVYLHGYSEQEQQRLIAQNDVLAKYIYHNLDFSTHLHLLEVGCGVGAQMLYLLKQYPNLKMTGLELEPRQIDKAEHLLKAQGISSDRFDFVLGDATDPNLQLPSEVDGVIMVWVLEHIKNIPAVLHNLKKVITRPTKFCITEVFHNSFQIYPSHPSVYAFWQDMVAFQASQGGDANIGLRLPTLLQDAGWQIEKKYPFPMFFGGYEEKQRNEMLQYWLELMESAIPEMKALGVLDENNWIMAASHMKALQQKKEAIFYYNFVQIVGQI